MSAIERTLEKLTSNNYTRRLVTERPSAKDGLCRIPLDTLWKISANGLARESLNVEAFNAVQRDDFAMSLALRMERQYSPLGTTRNNSLAAWAELITGPDIPKYLSPLIIITNAVINGSHHNNGLLGLGNENDFDGGMEPKKEKSIREAGLRSMIIVAGAHRQLVPEFLDVALQTAFTPGDYRDSESVRAGVFRNSIPELLKLGPTHATKELSDRLLKFATKPGGLSPELRAAAFDCEAVVVGFNPAVAPDVKNKITTDFIHHETEVVLVSARKCVAVADQSGRIGARMARARQRLWAFPSV